MEPQTIVQSIALGLFLVVYVLFSARLVHRAVAALVGAVVAAGLFGMGGQGASGALSSLVPEALLATAGLMVLAGFVKRSGLASWLALLAAQAGRGHPRRILVFSGLLTFILGGLLGPVAAVTLVVPVTLLLAVELDVPVLPFVVVLSWTSLLGGATVLTSQPGNLWLGSVLGINGWTWALTMAPYTLAVLAVTLVTGTLTFGKSLRVTNERRARVLEYDPSQSLGNRALLVRTIIVLGLVIVGVALAPALSIAPSLVILAGATVLILGDGQGSVDRALADLDGATLLFFGGLFVVAWALFATGIPSFMLWMEGNLIPGTLSILWGSALLGTVVDHGALVGAATPFLQGWSGTTTAAAVWPLIILGSTLGAGATVLGSTSTMTALGLAVQGGKRPTWRQYSRHAAMFAVVNLVAVSLLGLVL